MSKSLSSILKLAASLGLGILIVYITTSKLSAEQVGIVRSVFVRANYIWIILGPLIGMLSNVVRAERWRMLLGSVGYEPDRNNVIYSVFVMYAGNLLFPRLGEVTRCTLLYRSDGVPVDKSIGTMVLERVVDMVSIMAVGLLLMAFQYDLLLGFMTRLLPTSQAPNETSNLGIFVLAGLALIAVAGLLGIYRLRANALVGKLWQFIAGIWEGLLSIFKLKNPILFIFYSILIWVLYFLMIYTCFRALPETSGLGILAGMACLFFGGFAFIVSQGGIGAYPATIGAVLVLYGVAYEVGFAFGWLVWSLQTAAVILFGVLSLVLIGRVNAEERSGR